ncbi:galectin-3-like [Pecten maximus]|uniref:galectin-3-like n=1 Tax=Pecten maximus TaxID=6579 RepID=UPI00145893D4|nr:galectin-3-like [Pecten maximus]XP_033761956.1 galectin-3-like [Pecten maximus]
MQNYGGPGGYPPPGGPGGYPPPGGQGYPPGGQGYPPGGQGFPPAGGGGYPQPGGPGFPTAGGAGYPGVGAGAPPGGAYGQPGYPHSGYPGMQPGGMPHGGMPHGGMPHGGMQHGGVAPGGMQYQTGMPYQGMPQGMQGMQGMPQQMGAMYGGPPIQNPPIPFETQIQGGLAIGRSIVVSGMAISGGSGNFAINFQEDPSGENIALHFNPRINVGAESNVTVLNTKSAGSWGQEDRGAPYFPFGINQQFEIRFIVDQDRFRIFSNNKPFCDYPHRIHPPQKFGFIHINGDVQIHQIRLE